MLSILIFLLVSLTKSSIASYNGLSDELRFIHQEIGSLRDENLKQNLEISSLKATVQLQNTTISKHETTIKELITGNHKMIKNGPQLALSRRKRPAQLIPARIQQGERKNPVAADEPNTKQFYGPPTSCSELAQLGYTLNGFYQVKNSTVDKTSPQTTKIETVYCAFKQEETYNPLNVQKPVISLPSSSINPFSPSIFYSPSSMSDEDIYFSIDKIRYKNKPYYGTLTFKNAFGLNIRDHFNQTTGYFKSPKNGIYHFSYEMTSFDIRGNETKVNFYMNEIPVNNAVSIFSAETVGFNKIIHQVTLMLKYGDTICLKAINKENSKYVSTVVNGFQDSIMGYFLKATP